MSFFEKLAKTSYDHIKDQAHFQNWCGTIAMVLSCLAFTGSIAFNKGVPSDQKKFLVSQELADGAVNVALFWIMTDKFKKWANKKIETGRVFPKEMKEKIEKVRVEVGEKATLKDMKPKFTAEELTKIDKFHSGFRNGVSLGGSLFAVSILTPIIRNVIASKFQEKAINREVKKQAVPITQQQRPTNIVKPLSVNPYPVSNAQMKI